MWTVSLLACRLSTAMNSTPESIRVAMNAKLRDSRSSFAMTSLAFSFLQARRAFSNSGRSLRLPLSTSVNSSTSAHRPAIQVSHDRFALRGEAEGGFALPICADAEISDELAVMRWHSAVFRFVSPHLQSSQGPLERFRGFYPRRGGTAFEALRPRLSGLGAGVPFIGSARTSDTWTEGVRASRSSKSTVGFSSRRSKPPTYDRSTPESKASRS